MRASVRPSHARMAGPDHGKRPKERNEGCLTPMRGIGNVALIEVTHSQCFQAAIEHRSWNSKQLRGECFVPFGFRQRASNEVAFDRGEMGFERWDRRFVERTLRRADRLCFEACSESQRQVVETDHRRRAAIASFLDHEQQFVEIARPGVLAELRPDSIGEATDLPFGPAIHRFQKRLSQRDQVLAAFTQWWHFDGQRRQQKEEGRQQTLVFHGVG